MTDDERQALLDYWTCMGMESVEALREALADLRRELFGDDQ